MDRLPVIHSQVLNLNIDPERGRFEGWTDIQFSCSTGEKSIGLHAHKLDIHVVTVDGHAAQFELKRHPNTSLPFGSVQHTKASDVASHMADLNRLEYERILQREEEPELLISIPRQIQQKAPLEPMLDATLRLDYSVSDSGRKAFFSGGRGYCIVDDVIRRARSWFPCVDTPSSAHPFRLKLTVPTGLIAVGPGQLHKVTETLDRRKEYEYCLKLDTPPCHINFVVGPFAILPGISPPRKLESRANGFSDAGGGNPKENASGIAVQINHFSPEPDLPMLASTIPQISVILGFFASLLGSKYPYPSLQQAFVPAGISPVSSAGLQILPSTLLFSEQCVEQAIESRLVIVRALAEQWFGVFMRAKAPADNWLLMGLAGWLEDQFVKKFMGRNEYIYRKVKEREAIYVLDNGQAPPLYTKGESYPWGTMHGTEGLDPSHLRRWKASAVIGMLEKRVGEEAFKKLVERTVSAACESGSKDVLKRLLGTRDFLKEAGRQGGFRKDITAFHLRWILGQGCPHITAAFTFHKKRSILEVALRQSGTEAARVSLYRAAAAVSASKEGSGIGIVEVQVRQDKHNPASTVETPVNIGTNALTLVELKLSSKQQMKRMKRKKKGAAAGEDDDSVDEDAADDPASALPVSWVRIDPQAELLAQIHVLQPASFWTAQLDFSKDVAAQSDAIVGLASERPFTYRSLNALHACLENPKLYCRVRIDAAMALGAIAHLLEDTSAMDKLIQFYSNRCFDSDTHRPRQHFFDNLSEQFVNQAVPTALAIIRDRQNWTPPEIADFLQELLEYHDNSRNIYNADTFLMVVVTALGRLRVGAEQVLESIVSQIDRLILRDAVLPSAHRRVTAAALSALANLTVTHPESIVLQGVRQTLTKYYSHEQPYPVQEAAVLSLHHLTAASLSSASNAVHLIQQPFAPSMREAVLKQCWQQANSGSAEALLPRDVQSAQRMLQSLYMAVREGQDCPRIRHLAFMLLQLLGRRPPSLFKEVVEEAAAGGPSMSMETGIRGRTQLPATSGAHSRGSKGVAASGIKVTLRGTTSMGGPPPLQGPRNMVSQKIPPSSPISKSPSLLPVNPIPAQSQVTAEPVFTGFPLPERTTPGSPSMATSTNPGQKNKNRPQKRRKVETIDETKAAQSQDIVTNALPSPSLIPAEAQSQEKQDLLRDVAAIMAAPSKPKLKKSQKSAIQKPPPAPAPVPEPKQSIQQLCSLSKPEEADAPKQPPASPFIVKKHSGLSIKLSSKGHQAKNTEAKPQSQTKKAQLQPETPHALTFFGQKSSSKLSGDATATLPKSDLPKTKSSAAMAPIDKQMQMPTAAVPSLKINIKPLKSADQSSGSLIKPPARPAGNTKLKLKIKVSGEKSQSSIPQQAQPPTVQQDSQMPQASQTSSRPESGSRVGETAEQRVFRKQLEKQAKAQSRAGETEEEKLARRAQKKDKKDAKRAGKG